VSEPSLYRYEAAKRVEAADAYALREKKPPDGSDLKHDGMEQMDRGYRGMHCIAWLRKYVAQACEHIPDVALRLLPCRKLADMHREYEEDQKSNPSSPLPVKVDAFRRIFHHCPDFADCKISDSKCNFGRCSTCRKGEMAIRRSAKGDHYEGLAAAKFDRYQHLLQIKMEKVSYYFEREMSRSPVALKVSLIIDKVLLALASIPSFITHHVHSVADGFKQEYRTVFQWAVAKGLDPRHRRPSSLHARRWGDHPRQSGSAILLFGLPSFGWRFEFECTGASSHSFIVPFLLILS
jgi:hypothetical protein